MAFIYRFRKDEPHSINNLLNLSIEGSKYLKQNPKAGELSLTVDYEKVKNETNYEKIDVDKVIKIIKNHILNAYFLSCFTTVDQINEIDMWKEYAENTGFCLVYLEEHICNAIYYSERAHRGRYFLFKNAECGCEAIDISDFIIKYLKVASEHKTEDADLEQHIIKEMMNNNSIDEIERFTKCMFHKIGKFPEKIEKRIVLLGKEEDGPFCNDMILSKIKPYKIVCSSLMNNQTMKKLRRFSRKNGIKFSIKRLEQK